MFIMIAVAIWGFFELYIEETEIYGVYRRETTPNILSVFEPFMRRRI